MFTILSFTIFLIFFSIVAIDLLFTDTTIISKWGMMLPQDWLFIWLYWNRWYSIWRFTVLWCGWIFFFSGDEISTNLEIYAFWMKVRKVAVIYSILQLSYFLLFTPHLLSCYRFVDFFKVGWNCLLLGSRCRDIFFELLLLLLVFRGRWFCWRGGWSLFWGS